VSSIMAKSRPKHLNLLQIRLPVPGRAVTRSFYFAVAKYNFSPKVADLVQPGFMTPASEFNSLGLVYQTIFSCIEEM